jgi:hypothetical protein
MQKTFEWDGKKYSVERQTLDQAEEYFELGLLMNDAGAKLTPVDRIKNVKRMLDLLNCPDEVKSALAAEDANECLLALEAAHYGQPEADGGNAGGGAAAH